MEWYYHKFCLSWSFSKLYVRISNKIKYRFVYIVSLKTCIVSSTCFFNHWFSRLSIFNITYTEYFSSSPFFLSFPYLNKILVLNWIFMKTTEHWIRFKSRPYPGAKSNKVHERWIRTWVWNKKIRNPQILIHGAAEATGYLMTKLFMWR